MKADDVTFSLLGKEYYSTLKPHCIRCSQFKVDVSASSKPTVRIVEDNVTASLH
jgi:hypothetical protein